MTVWVFEENLMWSARLANGIRSLGHTAVVRKDIPEEGNADMAIVNLGAPRPDPRQLVPRLRELGVRTLAHAGHKEKELHELGRDLGCDLLATNSELTHKLPELLEKLSNAEGPQS